MSDLLKSRVSERLAALRTNAFEAARHGDLERNFINDILNGKKTSVRGPNLLKLAQSLRCSADYLIREGAEPPDDSDLYDDPSSSALTSYEPDLINVPEFDVRLSAGPGALTGDEPAIDVWAFSRRYLVGHLHLNPATLAVVQVVGDSMEPTLRSGDRVLIDHNDTNPARGGIFAIWDSDSTVVKRLERVPMSDPAQLVLISDNKNHNQYKVAAELVRVIGRVVWYARRM